jgi:hypothetical protein
VPDAAAFVPNEPADPGKDAAAIVVIAAASG